jgi:TATA-box binding protein (TBP) (component of TFIID and TFIIIB)
MFETGGRFKTMFRSFARTNDRVTAFTPMNCSVSTMTICGKLDATVDVDVVMDFITNRDHSALAGLSLQKGKKTKGPDTSAFYNQLTIKAGTTSIKIFRNGAIHVTGAKSVVHFVDVIDRVCTVLGTIMEATPSLESASISMINVIFCAARTLPLTVLRQALEDAGHPASYDPDAYPGVNAKVLDITVLIFTTGSVIISGAKTPEHVADVYNVVCTIIDALPPAFPFKKAPIPTCTPANADVYSIVDGYSSRIAHLCIDNE